MQSEPLLLDKSTSTDKTSEIFTLQPEMAAEMQRLIDNAAASVQSSSAEEGRVLRSAGKQLRWNPELGSDQVIIEE